MKIPGSTRRYSRNIAGDASDLAVFDRKIGEAVNLVFGIDEMRMLEQQIVWHQTLNSTAKDDKRQSNGLAVIAQVKKMEIEVPGGVGVGMEHADNSALTGNDQIGVS